MTETGVKVRATPAKPAGWRGAVCRCDCGETITVTVSGLLSGKNKSCGCLKQEAPHLLAVQGDPTTHGLSAHPLYMTWAGMMHRCYNSERGSGYRYYGARGIRVCEPWHDPAGFIAGVEAELGPRPEGRTPGGKPLYSIDRIDNDGDYEPGNVRWATAKEQQNNKRNNRNRKLKVSAQLLRASFE